MSLREAAQQALAYIEEVDYGPYDRQPVINALRAALAETEQEQEPVAWWNGNSKFATPNAKDWDKRTGGTTAFGCDIPLYTAPTPRKPLTDEKLWEMWVESPSDVLRFARAIERAHGIGEQHE